MNIAASPDPILLSAPDENPGNLTEPPIGLTEIPFADLLGMPPESLPEGAHGPSLSKPSPRKQAEDTMDPALITLLPYLAQQVLQTPPSAPLPQPPEGEATGVAQETPVNNLQAGSHTPSLTQNRGLTFRQPQRSDRTLTSELPPAFSAANPPPVAADEQNQALQTDGQKTFTLRVEHPVSPMVSTVAPSDLKGAEVIERQTVQRSAQTTHEPIQEPIQEPFKPRELTSVLQPGPETGTNQPLQPGTIPPAGFAPAAVPVPKSEAMPLSGTPDEDHSDQMHAERNSAAKSGTETGGTTTAMQLRNMPDQFTERSVKAKPNGPATSSAAVQNRASSVPDLSTRAVAERRIEPEPMVEKKSLIRTDTLAEKRPELPAPAHTTGETTAPLSADATAAVRITRQTMDLAEHVRAMGRDHVEVQMRLRDGEEVTVSLRLEKGEWKPVFKTDSEALCRALEQNWNRAAAQPSAQTVRFGTPVFESQPTQTGGGQGGHANGHQQPDARDRSFNRREQQQAFAIPPQPARTPLTTASPTRTAASTTVRLYA